MIEMKKKNMFQSLLEIQICGAKHVQGTSVDARVGARSLIIHAKSIAPPYMTLIDKCMAPYTGWI
jgi:hypothetical protein